MQAVAQQTGVPPDTLRSWERRYGFPAPARTDSNRRLYSEWDIAAISWVREQTELGQGTNEAIAMLQSRQVEAENVPSPPPVMQPRRDSSSLDDLVRALSTGQLDRAHRAWDCLALAVSAEALCTDVLLPAKRALAATGASRSALMRGRAFLARKASLLFDQASPDLGEPAVCFASPDPGDVLPPLVLGTALARAGFQVITPVLDLAALDTLAIIRDTSPWATIIVAGSDDPVPIAEFTRLMPEQAFFLWTPDAVDLETPGPVRSLPADPQAAAKALRRER